MKDVPLVTSYLSNSRDRALLRYSLWIADNHRCYICDKPTTFTETDIDHILPQELAPEEFDRLWGRIAHSLPNKGVHDICNLRAACENCNSKRHKGSIVLSDTILDTHLAKSAALMKKAFDVQIRMRKNSAIGESAVHLTTARTPAEYAVLWDDALSQALIATLYDASQNEEQHLRGREIWTSEHIVDVITDGPTQRLLAALQIVSGVSLDSLLGGFSDAAADEVNARYSSFVKSQYDDLRGAAPGAIGWMHTLFTVTIDGVTIAEDDWRCDATVSIDDTVSAHVNVQSENGDQLISEQTDASVKAELSIRAIVDEDDFEVLVLHDTVEFDGIPH